MAVTVAAREGKFHASTELCGEGLLRNGPEGSLRQSSSGAEISKQPFM